MSTIEAAADEPVDVEPRIDAALDRIIEEGRPRLQRSWAALLSTGVTAGAEVGFGVLALLYVDRATGDHLLGAIAFSIGFIALLLGHSELFTEGFLVPVTVVAAGAARVRDLVRLWFGTLVSNLGGGFLVGIVVVRAYPSLHREAADTAAYYVHAGINARSFCLAVLAGSAVTLMTRMHNGTDSTTGRIVASVSMAFLLSGLRLFHSILDSLLAFFALLGGRAPFGYLDWAGWLLWTMLGNLAGGLFLTTLLRLVRSSHRLAAHRAEAVRQEHGGSELEVRGAHWSPGER